MSEFTSRLDRLRSAHLDTIRDLIAETVAAETPRSSSLVEMCDYHMSTGGKRLRALLPLAVAETLGADPERVIPFGAACELLHNATLVHDDIQDGDRTRRGQDAAWVRYGTARAINLGDAMLYWTLLLVGRLEVDSAVRQDLSQRLVRETIRVIDGQEREFLLKETDNPNARDYARMVEGKTSGLFALPVAGAARLADADDTIVEGLEAASGHLGVLFQIQDDILDLYGEKGRTHRGMDLCEGKMSILVVHLLEEGPEAEATRLKRVLDTPRREVSTDEIDAIAQAFIDHGSLRFALDEIDRRRELARATDALEASPELQELMDDIAEVFLRPIQPVIDEHAR